MPILPFMKKEPTQLEMLKDEQNFSHQENLFGNVAHPQSTDEQVYLDQQEKRSDLIQWQQDLSPEIQQFIHKIRRENKVGEAWISPAGMLPLANEMFIFDVVGLIELSTNKNLINSNYSENRVLTALKFTLFDFRKMLMHRGYYGLHKYNMDLIVRLFKNAIEPTYWRCLNNGERKYAGDLSKRVEVHTDNPNANMGKKGLFGMGG